MICNPCKAYRHLKCEGDFCSCCGVQKVERTVREKRPPTSGGARRSRSAAPPRPRKQRVKKVYGNCTEPGCGKPEKSMGLCSMHYERQRRAGLHPKVRVLTATGLEAPIPVQEAVYRSLCVGATVDGLAKAFRMGPDTVRKIRDRWDELLTTTCGS